MRIYFRHGLYRADKDASMLPIVATRTTLGLVAKTSNTPLVWTIAHYEKNYTVSEYGTPTLVVAADLATACWVYVDLNLSSGKKTYGYTRIQPTYSPTAPKVKVDTQLWFDTINVTMKVWTAAAGKWIDVVRVVTGYWNGTAFQSNPIGSSVAITSASGSLSGTIVFDPAGKALKDSKGRFVTTEDKLFSDSAATHEFSLESNVTNAIASESIPAFHVVKWTDFNTVGLASYADTGNCVVAISLNSATRGEPVELCLQGKIVNDQWNWPTVNASLWIDTVGTFSVVDPFDLRSFAKRKVQVARVLDTNTIVFDQGFGGIGEKGDSGTAIGGATILASDATIGQTKLSVAPDDSSNPVAVGSNDPILTAPRVPITHRHPSTEVIVTPFGSFVGTNAQQALEYVYGTQLQNTGGTVTGPITSTSTATLPSELTTLAVVQAQVAAGALNYKRYDLSSSTALTIYQAFNTLSVAQRTLSYNDLVFIAYAQNVYLWTGGPGAPASATSDAQFMWIGTTSITTPEPVIAVKTFIGTLVVLSQE